MVRNIIIAGASYSGVPAVELPLSGGGMAVFFDTSDADAVAANILSGKTAYVDGVKITGTAAASVIGTNLTIPEGLVTLNG